MATTLLPKAFRRLVCLLLLLPCSAGAVHFHAERLNGAEPIISAEHSRQLGARKKEASNINAPSVIRLTDWIPKEQRAAPEVSPAEVLRAEKEWEGAGKEPERSKKGPEYRLVNALRDPYVFNDRGNLYLFYAGGGEQAIGVARLTVQPD